MDKVGGGIAGDSSTTAVCAVWQLRVCRRKKGSKTDSLIQVANATTTAQHVRQRRQHQHALWTLSTAAVQLHSLTFRLQGYPPDVPNSPGPQKHGCPIDHFL